MLDGKLDLDLPVLLGRNLKMSAGRVIIKCFSHICDDEFEEL